MESYIVHVYRHEAGSDGRDGQVVGHLELPLTGERRTFRSVAQLVELLVQKLGTATAAETSVASNGSGPIDP